MGLSGYTLDQVTVTEKSFGTWLFSFDSGVHLMYNTVDWIYTYVETIYMFNYKITYFRFLDSVFDDSLDLFFLSLFFSNLHSSGLQLLWSILLDKYNTSQLSQLSLSDDWVRSFMSSKDSSLFVIYHPEILFFKDQVYNNYYLNLLSEVNVTAVQYLDSQSLLSPIMLFPQLLFIVYVSFFFIAFFFSFYLNSSKEESSIDADYLCSSITIESEKELGSIDDIILPIIVITYAFGCYFYFHFWNLFNGSPELAFLFFSFPMLYYIILGIPTFLVYDLGILFICYLKGVSTSSSLLFELVFDYVAIISLYVRLLTQAVRLFLMFLVYASMHDYILYMDYSQRCFTGNESFWEQVHKIDGSLHSLTYFYLGVLPGFFFTWLYEIIHTFFVVTGQIIAYFSMIFWLFLFLFTFFVTEKQENFFYVKRESRRGAYKKIHDYINNRG